MQNGQIISPITRTNGGPKFKFALALIHHMSFALSWWNMNEISVQFYVRGTGCCSILMKPTNGI